MNRNGELEDIGVWRGTGVNNPEDKISTNRLGIPASIQEWWDYDLLGTSDKPSEDLCRKRQKIYDTQRNKKVYCDWTTESPASCCDFPIIHGSYVKYPEEVKPRIPAVPTVSEVLAEIMRNK